MILNWRYPPTVQQFFYLNVFRLSSIAPILNHPGCSCYSAPPLVVIEEPRNPCNPSPCGSNAVCKERAGAGSCTCLVGYFGDPYTGCRPECVTSSECAHNKACLNMKCTDPCPGTCGVNAKCSVVNHTPQCYCPSGFSGNALSICRENVPRKDSNQRAKGCFNSF